MQPISIYIHIPFCVRKCAYCDFTSFPGRSAQMETYLSAVCREMRAQAAFFGRRPVGTVFIGVSGRDGTEAFEFHFTGSRDWVRTLAKSNALNRLRLRLK